MPHHRFMFTVVVAHSLRAPPRGIAVRPGIRSVPRSRPTDVRLHDAHQPSAEHCLPPESGPRCPAGHADSPTLRVQTPAVAAARAVLAARSRSMRWFRDAQFPQAPRGRWLRTLVVLGLVVSIVAQVPLWGSWVVPTWLNPGGTSTVAGSVPPPGAPGVSGLLASSKHKHDKHGKHGKHKGGTKGQRAKGPGVRTEASKKPRRTPTPTPPPSQTPTPTPTPPTGGSATLLAAGDIASCSSSGDEATAKLLDGLAGTVATLGDNAYESGTASEYTNCFDP